MSDTQNNQSSHEYNGYDQLGREHNWYVRMHQQSLPSARVGEHGKQKHRFNFSIFFRIWLTVALIVIIAGFVVFEQLFEYIEPTSKQVIEDTLVDTGKVLAVQFAKPLETGQLKTASYQAQLDKAFAQYQSFHNTSSSHDASSSKTTSASHALSPNDSFQQHTGLASLISLFNKDDLDELNSYFSYKTHSSFRVYVTDDKGRVIYDSLPEQHTLTLDNLSPNENAEGKDYSQWNDVYLTLQGKYGARSSRSVQDNQPSSIMYVAQPIVNAQGKLIGVVSVGKPVATILPYINVARQRMLTTAGFIVVLAVLFAGVVAWWLRQSIALVTRYTSGLASVASKPSFYFGHELNELTNAIEDMKHRLENKAYVTDYVHTLTHELKSPLTAIKASGELLADADLDEEDRQTLSDTINEQSEKLQLLIDRLLLLAKVEQPNFQLNNKPIYLVALLQSLLYNQQANIKKRGLSLTFLYNNQPSSIEELLKQQQPLRIMADEFWLSQALNNILENAVYFAHQHIYIAINDQSMKADEPSICLQIMNDGELIPDYALDKVFDRYFSLAQQQRQSNKNKGTGLGLTLAKQVIEHHGGQISIKNLVDYPLLTAGLSDEVVVDDEQWRIDTGVMVNLIL